MESVRTQVVIIGAGPCGMGAAWRLEELKAQGHAAADWVIVDSAPRAGGAACAACSASAPAASATTNAGSPRGAWLVRSGDVGGGPWRVHAGGRMHVHNQDRFASIARLRESIQIGEVQAGIPVGESKVGAGIMVGHGFPLF